MKVVLHYRASPLFRAALEAAAAAAQVDLAIVDEDDAAGFAREIADTDVLFHVLKPVTGAMFAQAPRLKLVQKIGVGVNTIDLDAARARGVAVANMPGTNSQAVAEMTLALMFAVLRRIGALDGATRTGRGWHPDPATLDSIGEIAGRTVGFVGFGAVPARLAPVLAALGAEIVYTARHQRADGAGRFVTLETLLESADIVSLHVPLGAETRGLIGRDALARIKRGAVLINTARGELVDETALVAALSDGRLRGAGLDVFAAEPIDPANPLLALANVVVTPHLAWLTPETLDRSLVVGFENVRRVRDSKPLLNKVV